MLIQVIEKFLSKGKGIKKDSIFAYMLIGIIFKNNTYREWDLMCIIMIQKVLH